MKRITCLTRRSALERGAVAAGLVGVGTRPGAAQEGASGTGDHCYYQIDFVAGEPIETLGTGEDAFYGRQNRLIQYAHADGDEVVERDTWLNSLDPEIRECVTADPIEIDDGNVSVEFAVADGCERQFSLAVYPLPGGEFSFDRRQELAAATTGTFGPGTHDLAVEDVPEAVCPSPSDGYEQLATLTPDDAVEDDTFGWSVAVSDSGGTVLVGAPTDDTEGFHFGSAHVFARADDGWTWMRLTPDDTQERGYFGGSVAVSGSGETAVVGSNDTGAYVFGRVNGTWAQRAKLTVADTGEEDDIGESVAVSDSGETVVVGVYTDEQYYTGSAYVFDRADDGWTRSETLVPDDVARAERFGRSVAVSGAGDTAVVGDPGNPVGYTFGSAYVFGRMNGTWTQRAKITVDDVVDEAEERDRFGSSVVVSDSGETAVITSAKSAYVFDRTEEGWTQRADLEGGAVAVSGSGDVVFVDKRVYSRANGTWTRRAKLNSDNIVRSMAVSDSGGTVVIGSVDSAYVFGR